MSNYKNDDYSTHQPYLIEILKNTSGNILECGCGNGSTILLNNLLKNSSRKLISLESNLEWLNKYTYLTNDYHKLYHIEAGNDDVVETGNIWVDFIKKANLNNFEVIFIDSSPWYSRISCFEYYLNKAKIIIIHDFDYYLERNIIGSVIEKEVSYYNNREQIRIVQYKLNNVKNYKLFYPPKEYFFGRTGPPTLICSNTMSSIEFNELIGKIENNLNLYYQ